MREGQRAAGPTATFDSEVWAHPDLEPSLILTSVAMLAWWIVSFLLGPALVSRRRRSARSNDWWLEEDGL
jgi:hypothetical protein